MQIIWQTYLPIWPKNLKSKSPMFIWLSWQQQKRAHWQKVGQTDVQRRYYMPPLRAYKYWNSDTHLAQQLFLFASSCQTEMQQESHDELTLLTWVPLKQQIIFTRSLMKSAFKTVNRIKIVDTISIKSIYYIYWPYSVLALNVTVNTYWLHMIHI